MGALAKNLGYLKTLLNDPNVGAIAPSSPKLVETICRAIDFRNACTIIELGAGQGEITKHLIGKMRPNTKLYAFETNEELVQILQGALSDQRLRVVHEDALNLEPFCEKKKLVVDLIIVGIPFTMMSADKRERIVRALAKVLKPKGTVILYQAWIPPFYEAREVRGLMRNYFKETGQIVVYFNLPPLVVVKSSKVTDLTPDTV